MMHHNSEFIIWFLLQICECSPLFMLLFGCLICAAVEECISIQKKKKIEKTRHDFFLWIKKEFVSNIQFKKKKKKTEEKFPLVVQCISVCIDLPALIFISLCFVAFDKWYSVFVFIRFITNSSKSRIKKKKTKTKIYFLTSKNTDNPAAFVVYVECVILQRHKR